MTDDNNEHCDFKCHQFNLEAPPEPGKLETRQGTCTVWLEFEDWVSEPDDDPYDVFFNAIVEMQDGRRCGLNTWTYEFLQRHIRHCKANGEALQGRYVIWPDLLVEKADRKLIEQAIVELINNYELDEYLKPDVVSFQLKFTISQKLSIEEQNSAYAKFVETIRASDLRNRMITNVL